MGNGARQKGLRAGPRLPMIFQGKPTSRLDPPVWSITLGKERH